MNNKTIIGMGGWELHPFNQYFYPVRPGKGFRKLSYYSRFFDCMEINATFYNTSFTAGHARRWIDDVAENPCFVFTVKLFQGFTHSFTATPGDVAAVREVLEALAREGKLGGLVMQFPYTFTNQREYRLYLLQLSKAFCDFRMFLEVRHSSWDSAAMYNFFQENRLHLINVDMPKIRRHIPFTTLGWDGAAYFRMMGRNTAAWKKPWRLEADGRHMVSDRYNYCYSDEELSTLAEQIRALRASVDTAFVVFHNDPNAHSLYNGFKLRRLLEPERRTEVPERLALAFPELTKIFQGPSLVSAPAPARRISSRRVSQDSIASHWIGTGRERAVQQERLNL